MKIRKSVTVVKSFGPHCVYTMSYSRVSNRRGGRNKRGGWQISAKIISGEGAINGEASKNLQSS